MEPEYKLALILIGIATLDIVAQYVNSRRLDRLEELVACALRPPPFIVVEQAPAAKAAP